MVPMMSTIHFGRVVLKSGRSLIKQLRMKKKSKIHTKEFTQTHTLNNFCWGMHQERLVIPILACLHAINTSMS